MDAVKRLGLDNDPDLLNELAKSDEVSLNRGALG
jgi:hypothetical protein